MKKSQGFFFLIRRIELIMSERCMMANSLMMLLGRVREICCYEVF